MYNSGYQEVKYTPDAIPNSVSTFPSVPVGKEPDSTSERANI
jgi:hypothetical protein